MYIYLEPVCPLFWGLNPPKQGLFQAKQGIFGFQVYIHDDWWWQLKYFLFSSRTLGRWSNLTLYIYIYNIFQMGLKPPIRWWSVQNSGEKQLQLAKKNTIFPIEIHPNNCCCHSCRHAFLRHPSQRSPQLSGVPVDLGSAFFQLVERWRKNLPYFPHFFPMGFHNIAGLWQDFWIIDSFF